MSRRLGKFLVGDDAATAVEYSVMLALIILTAIGAIMVFGQATSQTFTNNNNQLDSVNFGS